MEVQATLDQRSQRESDTCIGCILTLGSVYALGWVFHGLYNLRVRERIAEENGYKDECPCLKAYCCLWCSSCQMAREAKYLKTNSLIGRIPEVQIMK
jgi:hypothetical protein